MEERARWLLLGDFIERHADSGPQDPKNINGLIQSSLRGWNDRDIHEKKPIRDEREKKSMPPSEARLALARKPSQTACKSPKTICKAVAWREKRRICLSERNKIIRAYNTDHAETLKLIKCTRYIRGKLHETLFLSAEMGYSGDDDGTFVTICTLQTNNILLIKHSWPAAHPFYLFKTELFIFRPKEYQRRLKESFDSVIIYSPLCSSKPICHSFKERFWKMLTQLFIRQWEFIVTTAVKVMQSFFKCFPFSILKLFNIFFLYSLDSHGY